MSTDRADPIRVLFAAPAGAWETYREALPRAFDAAGLDVELSRDIPPEAADYLVVTPKGPIHDFSPFTRARAVLNLWAGVEALVDNPTLTQPLVRMIDPGLTQGMVEWVTGHALRHHLNTDLHVTGQDGIWRSHVPPLAQDRPVTVLGLGELGAACAQALAALGFPVTGWSRGAKAIDGIRCLHGSAGLETALRGAQIVILLLPLTLPAIILGLGLLYAISLFGMRPGVTAAILGHSVISVPYVAYFVLAALANYDLTLERASLDLGAGRVRTFVRITLPMIRQGVIVGAVFAFLLSFDNISLSLFLTRGDTLPLRLLQRIQYYADPSVAAVSTGLIALSILLMLPIRGYLARSFEPRR